MIQPGTIADGIPAGALVVDAIMTARQQQICWYWWPPVKLQGRMSERMARRMLAEEAGYHGALPDGPTVIMEVPFEIMDWPLETVEVSLVRE